MNYIYLKDNNKAYFLKYIKNANIKNYYRINPRGIIFKTVRKFQFNRRLLWGKWKKSVNDYNLFIMGENCFNPKFTKYIKINNPNCRIIVFFWNCIDKLYQQVLNDPNVDEFWSFDKNDVKKYNMKYNTQFYSKNIKLPKKEIINDVIFYGREKGRNNVLKNIEKELILNDIKYEINIIKNESKVIPYEKYLELVASSKAILDICSGEQIGLSLRCMESIFFEKKLITNNKDIVNYNFYNPNNIFIIGKDDFNNMHNFINTKYEKIDNKIVEYYDYDNWLKRFN